MLDLLSQGSSTQLLVRYHHQALQAAAVVQLLMIWVCNLYRLQKSASYA